MPAMERADLITGVVQSGGRPPADGDLRLVQDFVNTLDREHHNDLLDGPEGLAAWLEHRGFAADEPGPADVAHAVEVREALRALLLANNGGPEAPGWTERSAACSPSPSPPCSTAAGIG